MDQAPTPRGGANPTAPAHLRWDIAATETHASSLATASATSSEIILTFGERQQREGEFPEVSAEPVRRIALSALTANNLAATLRKIIEDYDSRSRR